MHVAKKGIDKGGAFGYEFNIFRGRIERGFKGKGDLNFIPKGGDYVADNGRGIVGGRWERGSPH